MKFQLVILAIILLLQVQLTEQSRCHSTPKEGKENEFPIWDHDPVLVKTVENGRLYRVGSAATNNTMDLLHVYGTPYEMGAAQGRLYGDKFQQFIDEVYEYLIEEVSDDLPGWIPESMKEQLILAGGNLALDWTYEVTNPYTNQEYWEELRGLCDTSGANYEQARRVQLIGELTKGHCSMLGAWGQTTSEGQTIQLRSLDWEFERGPFRHAAAIVVYHPSDPKYGNKWINIGLMGFIGSLSGVNDKKMAISEIGVSFPVVEPEEGYAPSFGEESRKGDPFTFVLREILQYTNSLDEAIEFLEETNRTCDLILGVGDANSDKHFRAFQYSYSVCNVIGDDNLIPEADWHPAINDAVYFGMDWNCPPWDEKFAELINEYYGKIDSEVMIRKIVPGLTSGNLQVVVYDLDNEVTYVSYGFIEGDYKKNAYENGFVKLDLKKLFAESFDNQEEFLN